MIFVDTIAWIALFDADAASPYSEAAREFVASIEEPLVTSDLVIAETHKWLVYHGKSQALATRAIQSLVDQSACTVLDIQNEDRQNAFVIHRKYSDQLLSLTTAMSVALMRRYQIAKVLSFNKHFLLFPDVIRVPETEPAKM
ncbi:MAG: PIN domain-containing protein [Candidatus Obscuribacterales bacterium]|nr:PIN domain-containing protein [Candidatus Obscuribacterales bacterium]